MKPRKVIGIVALYLGLSILLGLIWLAVSYPEHPSTPLQWLAMFLLAVPVQLSAELVGNCLWRSRLARHIDDTTQGKSISLLRIAYGLAASLLSIGLLLAVAYGWHALRPLLGV